MGTRWKLSRLPTARTQPDWQGMRIRYSFSSHLAPSMGTMVYCTFRSVGCDTFRHNRMYLILKTTHTPFCSESPSHLGTGGWRRLFFFPVDATGPLSTILCLEQGEEFRLEMLTCLRKELEAWVPLASVFLMARKSVPLHYKTKMSFQKSPHEACVSP